MMEWKQFKDGYPENNKTILYLSNDFSCFTIAMVFEYNEIYSWSESDQYKVRPLSIKPDDYWYLTPHWPKNRNQEQSPVNKKCKYCEKILYPSSVIYERTDNKEVNCEPCEIVCRIAVDMISSGVKKIYT